jgi:hypothetical protein
MHGHMNVKYTIKFVIINRRKNQFIHLTSTLIQCKHLVIGIRAVEKTCSVI